MKKADSQEQARAKLRKRRKVCREPLSALSLANITMASPYMCPFTATAYSLDARSAIGYALDKQKKDNTHSSSGQSMR